MAERIFGLMPDTNFEKSVMQNVFWLLRNLVYILISSRESLPLRNFVWRKSLATNSCNKVQLEPPAWKSLHLLFSGDLEMHMELPVICQPPGYNLIPREFFKQGSRHCFVSYLLIGTTYFSVLMLTIVVLSKECSLNSGVFLEWLIFTKWIHFLSPLKIRASPLLRYI